MTYTIEIAKPTRKCHECGEEAVIVFTADCSELETGYIEEVALCTSCAELIEMHISKIQRKINAY